MTHHYAIFSARYAPLTGGVESYTRNLARALAAEGNRVSIVTSKIAEAHDFEREADRVEVWRLPCTSLMDGRLPVSRRDGAYQAMMRQLASSGIDRVLVNTRFYAHSLAGLEFARTIHAPVVVLDHGSAYLSLGSVVADAAIRAFERAVTRVGKRYQPIYAGVSAASCAFLETFGIQTTHLIENAIDAPSFRAESSGRAFREELGVADDQTLVAFCGRLEPEKGALLLAEAAALLDDSFVFALAGEGSERGAIENLGLGNVHLLSVLSHADLSALFAASDLFCLPTRSEGFCTALLEAGSWGLTPVISHVGGTDEILGQDTRLGYILPDLAPVTIAGALTAAVASGRTARSDELIARIERDHTWSSSVRELEACFEEAERR